MTRRLAVATGLVFAVTAVLAAIGDSPVLMMIAVSMSVLCFAAYALLVDHGIE